MLMILEHPRTRFCQLISKYFPMSWKFFLISLPCSRQNDYIAWRVCTTMAIKTLRAVTIIFGRSIGNALITEPWNFNICEHTFFVGGVWVREKLPIYLFLIYVEQIWKFLVRIHADKKFIASTEKFHENALFLICDLNWKFSSPFPFNN